MIVWNDAHIDDKASLPAYDDDHAFERLPSYRRGSHARDHVGDFPTILCSFGCVPLHVYLSIVLPSADSRKSRTLTLR